LLYNVSFNSGSFSSNVSFTTICSSLNPNEVLKAKLYLAPPLSTTDIANLETLSNDLAFNYNAISSKKKVNRKGRNSKIEIYLS